MSESRAMQRFPLLFAALEGMLRHAQMMGVDYHEDALKVLLKVGALPSLPLRMRLASLCVAATAYQYVPPFYSQDLDIPSIVAIS